MARRVGMGYPCRRVHPGSRHSRTHLRRHRRRVGHQRRVGGQRTDRERAPHARARARPRRQASRLSDRDDGELGVRGPQPPARGGSRDAGKAGPHGVHDAPGVGALVRQRRRESLLRSPALRLDARLSRRRPLAAVGPAVVSLERSRLRGQRARRPRRRLADPLQGHRPLVRSRRAVRRHQRQPRRAPAASGQPVPAAHADELPGTAGQGAHRQGLRRPGHDHRTGREPDAAAQRPRHLSVSEPVHSRLPVWRLLQQQRVHAAGGVCHRQIDAAPVLHRHRADLRPERRAKRRVSASSMRRRTRRRNISRG